MKGFNPLEAFLSMITIDSSNGKPNRFIDEFMDLCFVDYANLYEPKTYINFLNNAGMEIVSSSKLDPYNKSVDHKYAHSSVVLVCKKFEEIPIIGSKVLSTLSGELAIDQLDLGIYGEIENNAKETILEYQRLSKEVKLTEDSNLLKLSLAYRVQKIRTAAYEEYLEIGYYDANKWHVILQDIFRNYIREFNRIN